MSGRIFTLKNDCREACSVFFVSEMCCRQVSVPFFTVKIRHAAYNINEYKLNIY